MKILFDHQIFYLQDFGGISRYFSELISRFNNYGLTTELSILHSNNECLKHLPGIENKVKPKSKPVDPYKSFLRGAEFRGKGFLYRAKNKFLPSPVTKDEYQENKLNSIEKIKEGNFDVFHPTYYDDYFFGSHK